MPHRHLRQALWTDPGRWPHAVRRPRFSPLSLTIASRSAKRACPVSSLPAPGPTTNEAGTPLGSTVWGTTLTSQDPSYAIEDSEQPGIVAGVYRNEKPPMIAEVISDAIALPILANANLSMSVKVL